MLYSCTAVTLQAAVMNALAIETISIKIGFFFKAMLLHSHSVELLPKSAFFKIMFCIQMVCFEHAEHLCM